MGMTHIGYFIGVAVVDIRRFERANRKEFARRRGLEIFRVLKKEGGDASARSSGWTFDADRIIKAMALRIVQIYVRETRHIPNGPREANLGHVSLFRFLLLSK